MRTYYVRVLLSVEKRVKVVARDKEDARRKWDQGEIFYEQITDIFIPTVEEEGRW